MLGFSVLERGRHLTVRARAKVNLGLEVLGRRADGYHELLTFLAAIDLADRVTLETIQPEAPGSSGIEVACDAPGVPRGRDNLAWRAAELIRREGQVRAGARIRIAKAIPVAAGLGGGSADAAAVLVGLSRLWGLSLAPARLLALATELGMDVPFFLGQSPALGADRGERLAAVPPHQSLAVVLVNPGFPLPTRDVYARLRPVDFTDGTRVRTLVAALGDGAAAVASRVVNGLEPAALSLRPGLGDVKAALLDAGALGAVMSGSGPTVIGIAASRAAALRIRAALATGGGPGWSVWVARTVAGPVLSIGDGEDAGPAKARRQEAAWGVAKR